MPLRILICLLVIAFGANASAGAEPPSPPQSAGDALFAAGDFRAAQAAYRVTLRTDGRNASAELGLARLALYANDLGEAEAHTRALATDAPDDPHVARLLDAIAARRDDGPSERVTIGKAEVDLPFRGFHPLPEIDAFVDGKPAHLLIDTGGAGLDLSTAFAAAAGIATVAAGQGVFAGGLAAHVRTGHADRLDLGGASIRSIPVSVVDAMPPGVDGVLGTSILARFLATIDYPHQRLILRPKSASAAVEARATARGAVIVPMLLVPDHFLFVYARANDAPLGLFNVDTGGDGIGVQLTKAAMEAANVVPDASRAMSYSGGGGDVRALPFAAGVTIGSRAFGNVPGLFFPDGDQFGIFPFRVAGTISQELFRRGALTFDFSTMHLIFDVPEPTKR